MSSEPIYYECACGYETYVAAYNDCPNCGRAHHHTELKLGNPQRRPRQFCSKSPPDDLCIWGKDDKCLNCGDRYCE